MALQIDRESTEFVYVGVTGDVPAVSAEVAFTTNGQRPVEADWETAIIVDDAHVQWDDAQAAPEASGDFYIAILVGPFNGNTPALDPGTYDEWLRLTDTNEQLIRKTPQQVIVT